MLKLICEKTNTPKDDAMRMTRTTQQSLFDDYSQHKYGQELQTISEILDKNERILELVKHDLQMAEMKPTGRAGLSIESVLRCIILKQKLQVSYERLAFELSDSSTYRAFVRLQGNVMPKKSCLQASTRQISAATLEAVNQDILIGLLEASAINFNKIRVDSTVVKSNIKEPSDSSLLNDSVRVLSRLLQQCVSAL